VTAEVRVAWTRAVVSEDIDRVVRVVRGLNNGVRERVSRYRTAERQLETALGRFLLAAALRSLGLHDVTAAELGDCLSGRPMLPRGYGGSISHAGGLVLAAAAAGCEIGVDIERADLPLDPVVSKLLPAKDWNVWQHTIGNTFARIWTAKEAIAKAADISVEKMLPIPLGKMATVVGGKAWFTTCLSPAEDYVATIACDQDISAVSLRALSRSQILTVAGIDRS
jgi:4'-phosphopantetheinyl transferase EntD